MIIGSCGHELDGPDGWGYDTITKSESCDPIGGFGPAISYETVCKSCRDQYKEWGILFESEDAAFKWIDSVLDIQKETT